MRVRVLGDVGLVRDQHDGQPALVVQPLEDPHHLDARARVEVAGRLVGEQQRRVVDQRAGDGDALLLAARQLVRMVIEPLAEADRLERRGGALAALLGADAAPVEQRQLHVLERDGPRQQVEALEHEADLVVADVRERPLVERRRRRGRSAGSARPSADRGSRAGA